MAGISNEVEQVVARTLRDSLVKLQQTTAELDQAVGDLVSACASARPSNSLPSMLRARSAAASLAASLEVLSKFVVTALQTASPAETELLASLPRAAAPVLQREAPEEPASAQTVPVAAEPGVSAPTAPYEPAVTEPRRPEPRPSAERVRPEPAAPVAAKSEPPAPELPEIAPPPAVSLGPVDFTITTEAAAPELPTFEPPKFEPALSPAALKHPAAEPAEVESASTVPAVADASAQTAELYELATWKEPPAVEADTPAPAMATENAAAPMSSAASELKEELPPEARDFDVLALTRDQQELHRRANRVAKVSMQDVKMLRPRDVALGKEHKDICIRLRDDIEKAHKEYDRRFHAILDHPVDYFYDWMVEILGDGDPKNLGDYPYPSPALRR